MASHCGASIFQSLKEAKNAVNCVCALEAENLKDGESFTCERCGTYWKRFLPVDSRET